MPYFQQPPLPDSLHTVLYQILQESKQASSSFLSEEWEASVISVAITFVVFIMGIPALIFQTFIEDTYRNIYNERFKRNWNQFAFQIVAILSLIIVSNPHISSFLAESISSGFMAGIIICLLIMILLSGWTYLKKEFDYTRNIEQKLSAKIASDAIENYKKDLQHQNYYQIGRSKSFIKDLEDLGFLAKELPAGTKKESFLIECERLLEYLIKLPADQRSQSLIRKILKDVVCLSVTYDGAKFNHENVKKVMDLVSFTYYHSYRNGASKEQASSNLDLIIVECMKEIGMKAISNEDLSAVMDAVDKLTEMKSSTADDLYALGSKALAHNQLQATVTVVLGLRRGIQQSIFPGAMTTDSDRRNFCLWVGLLAKMFIIEGATQIFVKKQTQALFQKFKGSHEAELHSLFVEANRHFYQQADFPTMDALKILEAALLPTLPQ